jgi:hypothetical protein
MNTTAFKRTACYTNTFDDPSDYERLGRVWGNSDANAPTNLTLEVAL